MTGSFESRSHLRREDPHLLQGDTTYVFNRELPNAAIAHFVTSVEAHALITKIDTTEARSMPGVLDVICGNDVELAVMPGTPPDYPEGTSRPVLPTDRVRYVGEALVAIVAETEAQAADAAEAVLIEYEKLAPVIGFDDALSDEVLLFPHTSSNVVAAEHGGTPGVADFSDCEVVVEAEFINQRVAPAPLEPRVGATYWTEEGRLVYFASCQGVHPLQQDFATYYQLDPSQVRVITADVGGSFGAKIRLTAEELLLPLLSKRVGRPIRWMPTRSADMVGMGHSRAQRQTVKIGGDTDGTIKVLDVEFLNDCGAYPMLGLALARNAARVQPGPLRTSRVHWKHRCIVTNTTSIVAYRGAGRPEGGALLDRAVNLFADRIGMDQVQIRRKNMLRADELPRTSATDLYLDSGDYPEALEMMIAELAYEDLKVEQEKRRRDGAAKQLGIGVSSFIDRTAGIPGAEYGSIELNIDGTFMVLTGSSPYGQGHYTTWAAIVAERTGVPMERIEIMHGDTDIVPRGRISGGSRSVQKAGSAIAMSTDQLIEEASRVAADLLEAAPSDVVLDATQGQFHVAGSPAGNSAGWPEVASEVHAKLTQADGSSGLRCEADYEPDGPTAPYGSYGAVVEVDTGTGGVELLRFVTVDDVGTVINPMLALGQVHGGVAQAIGQALYEEFIYDDSGNALTSNLMDYTIPSAAELPSFDCHLTEHPTHQNPLGAKGIGESGTIGATPAVQNAVIDALSHLGVRHIDLPLTPQKVWQAISSA